MFLETRGGLMYLERPDPFAESLLRLEAVALSAQESLAMLEGIAGEIE